MGGSHTSNIGSTFINRGEFGHQEVTLGGSTGAGPSIPFINLALIQLKYMLFSETPWDKNFCST